MDKLYYIVCEEKGEPLYEGRFMGRTRGAALKFLKEKLGRENLQGTVFTVTEIPVNLIAEIVQAVMKGEPVEKITGSAEKAKTEEKKPERFDAFEKQNAYPVEEHELGGESESTQGTDWKAARKFYQKCRSPKQTAEAFGVSVNTVKTRINREGWR